MPAQRKSITIDHLCRVEGYGGISVKVENGKIIQSNMNIFEGARFFEAILNGRSYDEVPQIASRVCAICSAVHSLTAIAAIEDAFGTRVSPQTRLLRDLLLQGGTIESHALHLFFLALPDYLGYSGAVELAADHPDHVNLGLALKKLGNSIQELIGGRSVHPVNALIGGFSALPNKAQLEALREDLQEGKRRAERMIALMESITVEEFCINEQLYVALKPEDNHYSFSGDSIAISNGERRKIREYKELCNEKVVSHSYAKHSHFKGRPFAVGSLARMQLNGFKLSGEAQSAALRLGLNESTDNILLNNAAQAVEIVYAIERSLAIVDELLENGTRDEKPLECRPKAATGYGALEAPRGILFHSYTFDDKGKVIAADIVTPTAINCANMEKDFRIATAKLIDVPKKTLASKLEKIARAYDPCISCSVH